MLQEQIGNIIEIELWQAGIQYSQNPLPPINQFNQSTN
jgi:hypothetical protein